MSTLRSLFPLLLLGTTLAACSAADGDPMSADDCSALGGRVILDPGDGSTLREGCAAGEELLGSVKFGIEGAICCKP